MSKLELVFIIILLFLLIFLFVLSFVNTLLPVPFIPTMNKTALKMINAVELQKTDIVYDLGSGDGRLVIKAAPKVRQAIGFDINPVLTIYSRLIAKIKKVRNATFITKSVFSADLSKCDKLFLYLSPKLMAKLEVKILEEMKNGSYIISNSFSFPNLKPVKEIDGKVKVYKIER